ncbi:MFS transporter [Sporosarcina sp. Te-1]|uniref:MFS transporter n=1 Tax=Sporosarcina sp. Te-1 TaxID=2818390 RepID=UPI001A9EC1A1|nr:MFS transporter [Sporosarcina sp. Te-1]QTD40252.1 MFS transporter [Sporosarcina sp. Te-1]
MSNLLINADFKKIWFHNLSKILSERFRELLIPIIVLGLSGSPLMTSFVLMAQRIGSILFSIPIGTWIEKRNPVLVSSFCNCVYAVLLFLLAYLIVIDVSDLFVIGSILFLMGLLSLVSNITLSAMVPKIVGRQSLLSANNLFEAADAIVTFFGPALGGIILAKYGPSSTLIICAILVLISSLCISLVKYRTIRAETNERPKKGNEKLKKFLQESYEGVKYLYANDSQIASTISALALGFSTTFIVLTVIIHSESTLRFSEEFIGILLSCAGIGNIIGVLIMKKFKKTNWLHFLSTLMIVSSLGILLLTSHSFIAMCVGMIIFDGALSMAFVVQITVQQGITPDHLIARVRSAIYVLGGIVTMLATLLSGLISEWNSTGALVFGLLVLLVNGLFIVKYKRQGVAMDRISPIYASKVPMKK